MSEPRRRIPLMDLALRNARRNTRRSLLTAIAVAVAVTAITFGQAYIDGILANFLDTFARIEAGHVRVRAEGYSARERFMPAHLFVRPLSDILPVLRTHPAVTAALPRIRTMVLVDGGDGNTGGLLMGVDLEQEEDYLRPQAILSEGRLPEAGSAEVMAGVGFADEMGVAVGDTLTLLGQTAYRSLGGIRLLVTGLASTGMGYLDKTLLVTSIDQAQIFTYMDDGATEVLVFARRPEMADSLAVAIETELDSFVPGGVEAMSWTQQSPIVQGLQIAVKVYGIVYLILLVMAALIIINTMLMTVMERTREFGMLAALGMRRGNLVSMILAEGGAIGLVGAAVGGAVGTLIAVVVEHTGIDITRAMGQVDFPIQGVIFPDWHWTHTLVGVLLGVITAMAATLYPAWRAVRLEPAEALRD